MNIGAIQQTLLAENERCAMQLDEAVLSEVLALLCNAQRVFVTGQGRSGLMMRLLAMRLMHLGLQAYIVGETITLAAQSGDVLIAASSSGETGVTCLLAEKAVRMGLTLIVFTTALQSRLARLAQHTVMIAAPTKDHTTKGPSEQANPSIQLMGALFEQQLHLLSDALCLEVARLKNVPPATLWARHANLE